jgi:hypothetical protein
MVFKCDRCLEAYDHIPTVIKAVSEIHFICPVCAYDLRLLLEAFVDKSPHNGARRLVGSKLVFRTDL